VFGSDASLRPVMQPKRELLISKTWMQAVIIVGLFGVLILEILAYSTYADEPPIPSKVLGPNGQLLFYKGRRQIGPRNFLKDGLDGVRLHIWSRRVSRTGFHR